MTVIASTIVRDMNRLERRFMLYLEGWREGKLPSGFVRDWWYEQMKFRIGHNSWYTPDFVVQDANDELVIYEVKGPHEREDSRIKYKSLAANYPYRVIVARERLNEKKRPIPNDWVFEEIKP